LLAAAGADRACRARSERITRERRSGRTLSEAVAENGERPGDDDHSRLRGDGEALRRIFELVARSSGPDFTEYRTATLERRLEARMRRRGIADAEDYLRLLEKDCVELEALWSSWLIHVSGFFRDPGAFDVLADRGLGPLIASKTPGEVLRIWVAGCATGEEAYSIAILMHELLERWDRPLAVRIMATDLSPSAVRHARAGWFPAHVSEQLSPARLARFFSAEGGGYRVRDELRWPIVFGNHDLLSDPPFKDLDLVSCRNLLIYWKPAAQERILREFYRVLRPGGLLLLGPMESLRRSGRLFEVVSRRWRLFRKPFTEVTAS
jgi:two-component system CheB/CheR fusion protein